MLCIYSSVPVEVQIDTTWCLEIAGVLVDSWLRPSSERNESGVVLKKWRLFKEMMHDRDCSVT